MKHDKKKIVKRGAFVVSSYQNSDIILITIPGAPEVSIALTIIDREDLFKAIDEVLRAEP